MTNRLWNVLMLLVRPDRLGRGYGGALVRLIERELAGRGARLAHT
ncbi:hypothetical protein [Exilibacterium tricleocarpae]|nr:hypothetical protein [Exilibacterium tricleocarpae]